MLLTPAPFKGTLTGKHPVGAFTVATLRELLTSELEIRLRELPPDPVEKELYRGKFIGLPDLLTWLLQFGIEAGRLKIALDTEIAMHAPTFGGRLKELRSKADISQETLAKKIGVPTGTVTQWETARRVPNLKMAVKIAKALGTDLNVFADCDWGDDEEEDSDEK